MRHRPVLTLILLPLASTAAAAWAQDAEIPDLEHPAYLEQQRQSDEADQRARDQMQRDAQQREDNYNQALVATQRQPGGSSATGGQHYAPARRPAPDASSTPTDPTTAALNRGDYPTALRLTREQASHGSLDAWHYLGYFYENGLGVRANLPLALAWYHSCADLGDADCQYELARMSYSGIVVPRDPVEAYKWLLLAGRKSARARQSQPMVARSLSYDQMSEATRRYQMWTPAKSVRLPEDLGTKARR